MTYLPDVNVWIALSSDRHVHYPAAENWFQNIESAQIAFCRITELGFLRLLTNTRVMGDDTLDPSRAWAAYDDLRADPRVIFLDEQTGFSGVWRKAGQLVHGGPNAWTDAYLGAFAAHTQSRIVTFDRRFKTADEYDVLTLSK